MSTANNPARQLNSKAIKDAILCYVVPEVEKKFCIASAKCTWRVDERPEELKRAWQCICRKRHECDGVVATMSNVAFFYSAISSCERSKAKRAKKSSASNDDDEDDTLLASQGSTVSTRSSTIDLAVEKKRLPAVTYWIAFESPNGAPVSLVSLRRKWFECDVGVEAKVLKQKTRDNFAQALCTVCKDHSSSYMTGIANLSYEYLKREALLAFEDELFEEEESDYSVVQFNLNKQVYWADLKEGVSALQRSGLQIKLLNIPSDTEGVAVTEEPISAKEMTEDPCTRLINDIERVMSRLGYGLHKGEIYKLVSGAKFTYQAKCSVNEFIGVLEGNKQLRGRLVKHGERVKDKLRKPESQVIHQLEIDYDLIEVDESWCLSLSQRKFVESPIESGDVGKITPRAYVAYDRNKRPEPKYFKEILTNSLSKDEIERFCSDYLGLLKFQQKQHKEKVPCLIGAADSGKTSLFAPILSIIPPNKLARVTKQRSFNKAMITNETQCIFIDEAHLKLMEVDDWKLLTQGGWTAHDVKYSTARGFVNRCPMLIACQQELQFEEPDRAAMDARLNKYVFKPLPAKDASAFEWLKRHPVDVILWAMSMVNQARPNASSSATHEPDGLSKHEMAELFECDLEVQSKARDDEEEEIDQEAPATDAADPLLVEMREVLRGSDPKSLEYKIVEEKMHEVERINDNLRIMTDKKWEEQKNALVEKGVPLDIACELPKGSNQPMSERLREEFRRIEQEAKNDDAKKRAEKAREAFENDWVKRTEFELQQTAKRLDTEPASQIPNINAYLTQLMDNLRTHHQNTGTAKCETAVQERRRACVRWGLIEERYAHLITELHQAMPECYSDDESETTFNTPVPTSQDSGYEGFLIDRAKRPAASSKLSWNKKAKTIPDFFR